MEPTEGDRATMTVDQMCEVITAATKTLAEKNAEIERLRNAIHEMMEIVNEHTAHTEQLVREDEEREHNG